MKRVLCPLAVLAVLALATLVQAEEWTRFRGPNGTGVSETKFPARWGMKDYAWTTKLPGIGHGSPVIWGKKVFLLSADPETAERHLLCISAEDGSILWQKDYESKPHRLHLQNSYASSTPCVDAERVYYAWSDPDHTMVVALDHEGNEVWKRDLGPFVSMHGFGTSPTLYQDKLILPSAQQSIKLEPDEKPGKSFIVALDKKSGKTQWKTPRESSIAAYSVPCVYDGPDGDELIFCSQPHGIFSIDPESGAENWAMDVFSMRTVASPIVVDGLVLGSTGSGGGGNYVVAVRPGKTPEEVYRIKRQAPYVPTPVAQGDLVFLWWDKGVASCIEAKTGKVHWRKRVGGDYSGSVVRAADKLYCIDMDGAVTVLNAGKEFKYLGRNPLGEASRSTPAIADGVIYLRTNSKLFALPAE